MMSSSSKEKVPKNILVTNAGWGIGLGVVRELLQIQGVENIFALEKNAREGQELLEIRDDRLHVIDCSFKCDESLKNAVERITAVVGSRGLNLLINNAEDLREHEGEYEDRDILNNTIENNAVAHVVITETFLPLLLRNADSRTLDISHAAIINISSDMDFPSGHSHGKDKCCDNRELALRMAKASLIEYSHAFAKELRDKGVLVVGFHPGAETEERFQPDEQAHRLMTSMCHLTSRQNGGYFAYDTPTPAF